MNLNPLTIHKSPHTPKGVLIGSGEYHPKAVELGVKIWREGLPIDWALQYAAHHSWGELSRLIYSKLQLLPAAIEKMIILGFEPDYGERARGTEAAIHPAEQIESVNFKHTLLLQEEF